MQKRGFKFKEENNGNPMIAKTLEEIFLQYHWIPNALFKK